MHWMRDVGLARSNAGSRGRASKSFQWVLVALGATILVAGAAYTFVGQSGSSGVFHPLTVRVAGIRSDAGVVRVTVCRAREQFPVGCELAGESPAAKGVVLVRFARVEEGTYAAAVFHDENQNGQLDMFEGRRVPSEGVAFSNDAVGGSGVPSFEQARFEFDGNEQKLRVQYMR